jgi:hypothetical protein
MQRPERPFPRALQSATSASGTNARTPASMTGYSTGRTPAFETSAPTEGGPTAVVLSPHRCPSARRGHAPSADRYLLLTDGMWATDPELLRRHRSGRRLLSRFWSRAAGQRFGDVAVVRSAARRVGACVRCQLIRDCPYQPLALGARVRRPWLFLMVVVALYARGGRRSRLGSGRSPRVGSDRRVDVSVLRGNAASP